MEQGLTVYVNSRTGSDDNEGTDAFPFRSLQHALAVTRTHVACNYPRSILLQDGTYPIVETLVLSADLNDNCLTITGSGPNSTTLSGGVVLQGVWTFLGNGLWGLVLAPGGPTSFRQLFVDGQRAIRGRHPNEGEFSTILGSLEGNMSGMGFYFNQVTGDLPPSNLTGLTEVELVIYASWQTSRRRIKAIHSLNSTVELQTGCNIYFDYVNTGRRYFAENFLAAVDSPGEWYFNATTATLFYFVGGDSSPVNQKFVVPISSSSMESKT